MRGVRQTFLNPNDQEVDISHFIDPAIPNPNSEEVDINHNYSPAVPLMDDAFPADIDIFSDIPDPDNLEADFPSLEDLVNEVTGGDVRNLDEFNDTILAGAHDSGVEVQTAVPSDETIPHTSHQPLNVAEFNVDVPKVSTSETPLTPVVLLFDGQMLLSNSGQLQMPLQNGVYAIATQHNGVYTIAPQQSEVYGIAPQQNEVYGIAPQDMQLITMPAQNAVSVAPAPLVAVNENAAGDTATVGLSHTPSPGSSKRTLTEESEGATTSKKQKLYQAEAFADPKMEKKRQNAINAKNHRDRTKLIIKDLEQKVAGVSQDRDNIALERDGYIKEIQELRKQNDELRKQTEDFKKKYLKAVQVLEIIQQQRKCGVPQADIDFLHQ